MSQGEKQQLLDLIDKYLQGKATLEEEQLLSNLLNSFPEDKEWNDLELGQKSVVEARMLARLQSSVQEEKKASIKPLSPVISLRGSWMKYAAVAIIFITTGLFFWSRQDSKSPPVIANPVKKSRAIEPGKEGAILTLEDGSQIVLDSLGNGIITAQNGVQLVLKSGQLAYQPTETKAGKITHNVMTTPRGRQFQLMLPDGTVVWLNAASSLRYPTVFTGRERVVELTGEAYFEVAKNVAMPFRVKMNEETSVKVLGTHFNINSYNDEKSINTTLLEGSVEINDQTNKALLNPGQQAQVATTPSVNAGASKSIQVIKRIDVDKVMAWKNGIFNFQNADLQEVMRQLARWYDLEVVYENGIPEMKFYGKMARDVSLSKLLIFLKESDVKFRLEDERTLVVMR